MSDADQQSLLAVLRADARMTADLAHHAGDRVHELVKMHAMTLPNVAMSIAFGMMVARQIYEETLLFAANSMEGDAGDAEAVKAAARRFFADLNEQAEVA